MKNRTNAFRYVLPAEFLVMTVLLILNTGCRQESGEAVPSEPAVEVGFLTSAEIPSLLKNGRPTMIEFGGRTCIPCKQMQPILTELKATFGEVIDITNFYLEDDYTVARAYEINLMPTQVIFGKDGKELSRHVGVWPRSEIEKEYRRLGIIE